LDKGRNLTAIQATMVSIEGCTLIFYLKSALGRTSA
jgi:hypothetical protein